MTNPIIVTGSKRTPAPKTRAIRLKCIDCCGGDKKEVKLCPCTECPLWAFRLGPSFPPQDPHIQPTKRELSQNLAQPIITRRGEASTED